jgi:hypothetical protein
MRLPAIKGVIDRRILVNYRAAPDVVAKLLPPPFRPQLVNGWAMAGICLIRLKQIRPAFLPGSVGLGSENAAHRIAVQWEDGDEARQGVYVARRDTSSRISVSLGGVLFPGEHHRAIFEVDERDGRYVVALDSADRQTHLRVEAHAASVLPSGSIFASPAEASGFFERGSLGYSPTRRPGEFDGLELRCRGWHVQPLEVDGVESSFFDDAARFPRGSVAFDCALLMREIDHEWHGRGSIRSPGT